MSHEGRQRVDATDVADQLTAATRAIEIGPCLELVFLPAPAPPGDLIGAMKPSTLQVDLLTTSTWETRPTLDDLRLVGTDLAEALLAGQAPETLTRSDFPPLTTPTSLFPTELRVAGQTMSQRPTRPYFGTGEWPTPVSEER